MFVRLAMVPTEKTLAGSAVHQHAASDVERYYPGLAVGEVGNFAKVVGAA